MPSCPSVLGGQNGYSCQDRLSDCTLPTLLAVSLSDEGFCVGVGDIVLECCCTDVSVMQSVFPVSARENGRRREESEERQEMKETLNDSQC